MARPNRTKEKRAELLPILASAFSELGYRKATTKALAARCGVQENILYRLWADKKAMFVASIDYLFDATMQQWQAMIDDAEAEADGPAAASNANASGQHAGAPSGGRGGGGGETAAERILAYDAAHRGESGFYRITFAALSETDDPDVRAALRRMYRNFTGVIESQIDGHRTAGGAKNAGDLLPGAVAAWAVLGVATAADIGRETGLLSAAKRKQLVALAGRCLLEGGRGAER